MKWIPTASQTASVPPTVVAPGAPCTTAAARSRGPSLRADASKRSSSETLRPTITSPSSTPIVAGTAAALAHGSLRREPDGDSLAGWEAVRDERRLERDHRAPAVERGANLVGDTDHGIAPMRAQQRAAASSPSSGPPTR